MKSRTSELLSKSVSAMLAAIEVYNKPDFKYREETFAILAINAWELLLKAKWLQHNNNSIQSIYVLELKNRTNGTPFKKAKPKLTASGNPFTHSLDWLLSKHVEQQLLAVAAETNLRALCEIRDSSVHFYNRHTTFATRLQEIGSATVKNFVTASQNWFNVDFSRYNFFLMPLAFVDTQKAKTGILLNQEEKNIVAFIANLEAANDPNSEYAVSVNIDMKFSRSKAGDALQVQLSNDPNAAKVQFSNESISAKYPFTYTGLTEKCKKRYSNFSMGKNFQVLLKPLKTNQKYCLEKKLDEKNPKTQKQLFYSEAVFSIFDKEFSLK